MALTKETIVDKVEVVGDFNTIQVRYADVIKEDGVEISRNVSREVIKPGTDVSDKDAKIQAVASAVHTQEVIDAWEAYQAEQLANDVGAQ